MFRFNHLPLYSTMKFFYILITRVNIDIEVVNYSTSRAFENHALSDITFEKNIINDKISTGLLAGVYSSYIVLALNPKSSRMLSSNIKLIIGPFVGISIIDPNVEKFGLIVNG